MNRLSEAGYREEFREASLLPDWWGPDCAEDPALLPEVEIRVARFLSLPLRTVRDPNAALQTIVYSGALMWRTASMASGRPDPAIHAAMQLARAVARNLREHVPSPSALPASGAVWREEVRPDGSTVTLDGLAEDLWGRGIPVVPVGVAPTPSFQGIACVAGGRPVVLLGRQCDEPGRAAFVLAHEAGHVAAGDCTPDGPVLDETILGEGGEPKEAGDAAGDSALEQRADRYAREALLGNVTLPVVEDEEPQALARRAYEKERGTGADAGNLIFDLAKRIRNYRQATQAVQALCRNTGARKELRRIFDKHVDIERAPETDRDLLRCVYGGLADIPPAH